ncbi:IS91 family transposase [Fulvimarina sp. 2208YS6-2-32]|uniref:IS91 family transposase n=1 Tax=Fulvimarina uroteuthidis TaxID=3098149 RepID=A0ABU5I183_9HYPH|nr:IS91 family transposase [Fulvimarina sp. 2208YS6-2-32]MDY8108723.1 IS91 family transposase [Fulvimarina sp. 2208YS6-2-32]
MAASIEVADIFRDHGPNFRAANTGHLSLSQLKVMSAIEACRTAALGGHVEGCDDCGHLRIAYNSCRNRHCPRCQGAAARDWLAEREADLLPVGYFHVVFTLPAEIAAIAFQNKRVVYDLLFRAASETVTTIAADPKHLGARIGITAVLHTWGSAMTHHPHLHMIVPGGGLSPDGSRWIASRPAFLLPVRVLGSLFRRFFLEGLVALHEAGRLDFHGSIIHLSDPRAFARHLAPVRRKRWVVYSKPPFAGPKAVLAYLSRYTHRVAISSRRITAFDDRTVTFRVKDSRKDGAARHRTLTLAAGEFTRTKWGRSLFAVGGNAEAARRSGIDVRRIRLSAFVLCSSLAALGGVFSAARLASASQQAGAGDVNLNAIAAAVIGGTSLFGGRGSAWSALLGVLVIQAISNGLTLLNLSGSLRYMITGAVLAIAVIVDSLARRSRASHGR